MTEHCDKVLIIEEHGRRLTSLEDGHEEHAGRIGEMETTLYGAERNGGGFIKETRDTLTIVREGVGTIANRVAAVEHSLDKLIDKRSGMRKLATTVLPPLIAAGATIAAVLLK